MRIRKIVTRIVRIIKNKSKLTSEEFITELREKGVSIGQRTVFFDPESVVIDTQQPSLIKIGDDVQVTHGVIILTHGYDWSVLKRVYGELLGSRGKVIIGNNVFIGMNSIILKNVKIGNNVIIGAGSLVTKDIPSNSVYGGSPARYICSIDDYYMKRKDLQIIEAKKLALSYIEKYKEDPPIEIFWEFFWIFTQRDSDIPNKFLETMKLVGNYEETYDKYINSLPDFNGYEQFLQYCKKEQEFIELEE